MSYAIRLAEEAQLPVKFEVEFRPYRLDSSLSPDEPVDREMRLVKKFGPEGYANARSMANKRGEEIDIKFIWKGAIRQTGDCHRLLRYAYSRSSGSSLASGESINDTVQARLADEIFRGYFEEGEDIGEYDNLAHYAVNAGLFDTIAEALEFLASDACRDEVEDMIEQSQDQGITGVPHAVVNDRWAIVGGQTADTYYKIFEKIATIPVH
ncbi:thioredoxin-like protein [Cantharellus anzutake]|uniref:thioredoxin-like protein n=1 Tax=Cantharellus anzutake TaxID=1750568 RepID=UPI001906A756|nr:thioredoxin-like protein [Cantharellus anzutake]KAF8339915.1 thioredoxin-like protein [Cantharellus anzutake]